MTDDLEIPSMDGSTKASLRAERDAARAELAKLRVGPCCPTCSDPLAANAAIRAALRDAETANSNCQEHIVRLEAERDDARADAEALRVAIRALLTTCVDLEDAIHSEPDMSGHLKNLHISPVRGEPALRAFKLAISDAAAALDGVLKEKP